MKLSRRELTLGAAAAALAPQAQAQNAPAANNASQQAQAARDFYQRNSETLTKFEIPMDTEPAFQFKP